MRVVSLVPSATETLLAWGVEPVAVTRFCEQPGLTPVGGTKDPDIDRIVSLDPDLVVMCEEENRRDDAAALVAAGVAIHVVRIEAVEDVSPAMAALAEALGVSPPWGSDPLPPIDRVTVRRRAFAPIWRRPWMCLSSRTYAGSLLAHLGIDVVPCGPGDDVSDPDTRYPVTTLNEMIEARADLVVAPSEPYPFGERHRPELEQVAPTVFVDGRDLCWWGVRTPAAIRRLGEVLAPAQR